MENTNQNDIFLELNKMNFNDLTETKKVGGRDLTYLSWVDCWAELRKKYPDASYRVVRQENGLPYVYDTNTGYMVFTEVTVNGETHEMWLHVMDGANNAMKAEPYKIVNKYGKETEVKAATMADINKTIMRCLAKNIAMFGLGIYIFRGEDFPEGDADQQKPAQRKPTAQSDVAYAELKAKVLKHINANFSAPNQIKYLKDQFGIADLADMTEENCNTYINFIQQKAMKQYQSLR